MIPSVDHFIGQQQVIARFRVALEAAWQDASPLCHMLMVGPPGTGKTLLAHLAAKEVGVTIHERIAQSLETIGALQSLLLTADERDIVFIDEIHELQPLLQTTLFRAMEDRRVFVNNQQGRTLDLPLNNISLLGATTDEYALLPPLRDRFKQILPFTFYDEDSLARIALQRAALMQIPINDDVAHQIARRAKGTPRLVVRLLEACHRVARSKGEDLITPNHFEQTLRLEGLDSLGLSPDEQRYLQYLADQRDPVRLSTLEAALGIHRRTLQSVVEPFLLRSCLIERSDKGRMITMNGLRHLGILTEEQTV